MQREFNLNATSLHLSKEEHSSNGPALKRLKLEVLEKRPLFRCRTCVLMCTCVLDSCASSCNLLRLLISRSVIRTQMQEAVLCEYTTQSSL